MPPELQQLEQTYLRIRAAVVAGQATYEDAVAELAKHSALDAAGNTWWVDPANSTETAAAFVLRTRDNQTFTATADMWQGSIAASAPPLPSAPPQQHPQSYGPVAHGQTPEVTREPLATNLPDVSVSASDHDSDDSSLLAKVDELAEKVPGGKPVLYAGVFVVIFILLFAVKTLLGGGSATETPDATPQGPSAGSSWRSESCFDGFGFPDSPGAPVSCAAAHPVEVLSISAPEFAGSSPIAECDSGLMGLAGALNMEMSTTDAIWVQRDGGTLLCTVTFVSERGSLVNVEGSVLNAAPAEQPTAPEGEPDDS